MEDIGRLNEAFRNFSAASRSLESYYDKLQEKVVYLTHEVAEKNLRLEEALKDAEEAKDYLRGILQSIEEAIIVLDPDRMVTMMNSAAGRLLCLAPDHAAGRALQSLDFSIEQDFSETILVAGGRSYNVIVSCSEVLDGKGRVRGSVILLKDITRLKEIEAQQERNHRLIAMGEMAAKIVHEIRSPLCSIELYAGMLARALEGTDHAGSARGISTGIRSLNNILTNMLFFARPHKPSFMRLDLKTLFDEAVFMIAPMLDARSIGLEMEKESAADISGDPELLKQVVLNILINAVQVTPDGGRIVTSLRKDEDMVVAEVKDEGEGIAPEDMERIFDPFFSTKDKGTGLGLTIASKIMQAHGGAIKVRSAVGEGCSFLLCFPCPHAGPSAVEGLREEAIR